MNDIQTVVLENFKYFVQACQRLELRYFLVNGSALGAKKYGGFIPWDDDLDVAMPRKDYEIFLKKAQDLLPEHLFVQNYRTDKRFPMVYSKIRNSSTAFIEKSVSHLDMNHGVYIDIFPLDGFNPEDGSRLKNLKIKFLYWWAFSSIDDRSKTKIRVRNAIFRLFGLNKSTHKALAAIEKTICNNSENSTFWCNHGDRQGKKHIPREWYGNGITAKFEGIDVLIPERYDEYLSHKYGEWKKDLPLNKQISHHKVMVCDLTKSYKDYIYRNKTIKEDS